MEGLAIEVGRGYGLRNRIRVGPEQVHRAAIQDRKHLGVQREAAVQDLLHLAVSVVVRHVQVPRANGSLQAADQLVALVGVGRVAVAAQYGAGPYVQHLPIYTGGNGRSGRVERLAGAHGHGRRDIAVGAVEDDARDRDRLDDELVHILGIQRRAVSLPIGVDLEFHLPEEVRVLRVRNALDSGCAGRIEEAARAAQVGEIRGVGPGTGRHTARYANPPVVTLPGTCCWIACSGPGPRDRPCPRSRDLSGAGRAGRCTAPKRIRYSDPCSGRRNRGRHCRSADRRRRCGLACRRRPSLHHPDSRSAR